MRKSTIKYALFIFGGIVGSVLGFIYYTFVGCNGSCMIASSPVISTFYGAAMGILTVNAFRNPKPKNEVS